jgi:putative DNA primase/helicase
MHHDLRTLAHALGGEVSGRQVLAPGPGHSQEDRSLAVAIGQNGSIVVHSFAGDDWRECDQHVRGLLGMPAWQPNNGLNRLASPAKIIPFVPKTAAKIEPDPTALDLWNRAEPIHDTPAEQYLQRRGITLTPPCLGFYDGAMIARVEQPYAGITAIQKTPINPDFTRGQRWTKGPLGTGAVRLGAPQEILGIAEGVETALSAMMLTGMSCWACLGASRMHVVELPPIVREVHIFADNDQAGTEAAEQTARVHCDLGRVVKIRRPAPQYNDYNAFLIADADGWEDQP